MPLGLAFMIATVLVGVSLFVLLVIFLMERYEGAVDRAYSRFAHWSKTVGRKK